MTDSGRVVEEKINQNLFLSRKALPKEKEKLFRKKVLSKKN
jgi:hypothetical protein